MKKLTKVLNTQSRIFCIITLAALIGFSMTVLSLTGCPISAGESGDGGGGGDTTSTPIASDFTITGLSQIYDGSAKEVAIAPKHGKSTGTITIYYDGNTTAPSAKASYTVTFDVAAATGWNAASGLSAGTLTIAEQISGAQTPTAADFDISNLTQTAGSVTVVTITPKSGKTGGAITIKYNGSTTLPTAAGTYTVTFDVTASLGWNAASGLSAGTLTITIAPIIEMVQIPGGSFQMGKDLGTAAVKDETPVHTVTLTTFTMGKYEVTQEQWFAVMERKPSYFKEGNYGTGPASGEVGNKRPVECVSWYNALVFCNKLSIMEGLTPAYSISGKTNPAEWGTVPTEAQWEYAAKGCNNGSPENYTYSGSDTVGDVAWYYDNSSEMTHEVGKKAANGLGLYDMTGNVSEWCWDWYNDYPSVAQTDPTGAASGIAYNRILRGGSWRTGVGLTRLVVRSLINPCTDGYDRGFRVVRP